MILLKVIIEGMGLGLILFLICAFGIRNGAVGLVHLYHEDVRDRVVELGLTTHEKINRNAKLFKLIGVSIYLIYVIVCVYAVNGTRGFLSGFWQALVILMIMNLTDRLIIDELWVMHTKAWIIPGTEDLMPYITAQDKKIKWLIGTFGWAVIAAALAGIMCLILK